MIKNTLAVRVVGRIFKVITLVLIGKDFNTAMKLVCHLSS